MNDPVEDIALFLGNLYRELEAEGFSQARRDQLLTAATPAVVSYYLKGQ